MKIAVEGCAHGELEKIYESISTLESAENVKVDLLLCCGDFQSTRNENDLRCMAVPPKYYNLCSFYKYYNGEKVAPVLTIFIGGNHEASNYLQELPYGGWVAPNIYYLGYAGVVNFGGLRIAGASGIYKGHDYLKGRFEKSPYNENSKRSVYHTRVLDMFRLRQISGDLNVFMSHDWPLGITKYGNEQQLLRFKPFFKDEINSNSLGSPPLKELLHEIKPSYWFAAHLHCKFAALIEHDDGKYTKFLSLDKCLPSRRFLQILDIPASEETKLSYDLQWLAILHFTNHLTSTRSCNSYMPGKNGTERWNFTPTNEEQDFILARFDQDLIIPDNFVRTATGHDINVTLDKQLILQPKSKLNPQTQLFCDKLGIEDPMELLLKATGDLNISSNELNVSTDLNWSLDDSRLSNIVNTPIKRTNIQLPEPKNTGEDSQKFLDRFGDAEKVLEDCKNDGKVLEDEEIGDGETLGDVSVESIETGEVFKIDKIGTDKDEVSEIATPPSSKKFKRRNIDIYKESAD